MAGRRVPTFGLIYEGRCIRCTLPYVDSSSAQIPRLAVLLKRHRDEIGERWSEKVLKLSNTAYRRLSVAELRVSIRQGLAAIIEWVATGSNTSLETYLFSLSQSRLSMGFGIAEVIEALVVWKDTTSAIVREALPQGSHQADELIQHADDVLRYMIGRFSHLYAEAMQQEIREQQTRTALMLHALQMASASLELDQVLERIAAGIVTAMNVRMCGLYLFDTEGGRLLPYAVSGDLGPDQRKAFFRWALDPRQDGLCEPVLALREPMAFATLDGHLLRPQIVKSLAIKDALVVPVRAGAEILGLALVIPFEGRAKFDQVEINLAAGIANAVALAVQNARLFESTRQRLAETQSLQRVTTALLQRMNLTEALGIVCREAQGLIGAQGGTVYLLDPQDALQVAMRTGVAPDVDCLPVQGSLVGRVVRAGRTLHRTRPTRLATDPVSSLLTVPLRVQGKVIGALEVVNKPVGFGPDDSRLLALFADQAAIAIVGARLYEQEDRLAVIQERQRLARDLHDSVTQSLYSVMLHADAARGRLQANDPGAVFDNLQELKHSAQEALREMRLLIYELRPAELEQRGLAAALQARLESVEERSGVECQFSVDGTEALPIEVARELYLIAQEALNNMLRHARAHRTAVHLTLAPELTRLVVHDDGVGLDMAVAQESGGLGLRSMAERAQRIGAHLAITGVPGGGTQIAVELAKGKVLT